MISFCVKPENIHTKYGAFCVCLVSHMRCLTRGGPRIYTAYIGFFGMPWRRQLTLHFVCCVCVYERYPGSSKCWWNAHIFIQLVIIIFLYARHTCLEHPPFSHSPHSIISLRYARIYGRRNDIRTPFFTQIITLYTQTTATFCNIFSF